MARFTSIASTIHARVSLHSAECSKNFISKAERQKRGLSMASDVGEAPSWKEARALLLQQLVDEGRDDISITVCPCAKDNLFED